MRNNGAQARTKCKRLGGVPDGTDKLGRVCTMPSSQGTDTDTDMHCLPLQRFGTARANTKGRVGNKINGVYKGGLGMINRLRDAEACATECLNKKDCVAFSVKVHCWLFNAHGAKEPLPANQQFTQGWTTYTRVENDGCV